MNITTRNISARIRTGVATGALAWVLGFSAAHAATLDVTKATIPEFQVAYAKGLTAERVTAAYLARVAAYEETGPAINAIIHMNPNALEQAKALDAERKAGKVRGPLHGIPIVLKDNFDTFDLPTTAGSQLLAGSIPNKDAFVTQKLRDAGVIIVAKVNMAEFANSGGKVPIGFSSGGLQTLNPHALDRSPGSSSGGTGSSIAAAFAVFGLGTDSQGSVRGPSHDNGIVGLKTTHGLVSKAGVIPLTLSLDTVGPMARNVTDIAVALNTMSGIDPNDRDTQKSVGHGEDYTRYLKKDALKGVRIGIVRQFMGVDKEVDKVTEDSIAVLKAQGAEIVDPVAYPDHLLGVRGPIWPFLEAVEFRKDVTDYLHTLKPGFPKDFDELAAKANDPATHYRSPEKAALFKSLVDRKMEYDDPIYVSLKTVMMPAFTNGVNSVFDKYGVTAMFFPTNNGPTGKIGPRPAEDDPNRPPQPRTNNIGATSIASQSGLPEIVIPAGMSADGMPITVSFLGKAFADGQIIGMAYAFEQATHGIRTPKFTPSLKSDVVRY
ncbi:MAG: amidase family protein [Rhodospirillaceae bacterium]